MTTSEDEDEVLSNPELRCDKEGCFKQSWDTCTLCLQTIGERRDYCKDHKDHPAHLATNPNVSYSYSRRQDSIEKEVEDEEAISSDNSTGDSAQVETQTQVHAKKKRKIRKPKLHKTMTFGERYVHLLLHLKQHTLAYLCLLTAY